MNTTQHIQSEKLGKMKTAELLSTLGAGVLGAGIALLFPDILARFAIPILFIGLVAHATGMVQMRVYEQARNAPRMWWVETLYWICWLVLGGLLFYTVMSLLFRPA